MTLKQFLYGCISVGFLDEKENTGVQNGNEQLQKLFIQNAENQRIPIFDLHPKSSAGKEIRINPRVITYFGSTLGLLYLSENEIIGNVCFANSDEIRSDFKTTFTESDILEYVYGCLQSDGIRVTKTLDTIQLKFPKNKEEFWQIISSNKH